MVLATAPPVQAFTWYNNAWSNRLTITIDHTKVSATLTDFPVLVKLTSSRIDWSKVQDDLDDIRFVDSTDTTVYEAEIDNTVVNTSADFWVRIPSVSHTTDTVFYMYFGNTDASSDWGNEAVWASDAEMVQHMNDATTSTILDSTDHNVDGTKTLANNPPVATGLVGSGQDFDGSNDLIAISGISTQIDSDFTVSVWIKTNNKITGNNRIISLYSATHNLQISTYDYGLSWRFHGTSQRTGDVRTDSAWEYVALSVSVATPTLYLNGVSQATPNAGPTTDTSASHIGWGYTSYYFDGLIDEVRVYSSIKSAAWLVADYNNMKDTLLSYYTGVLSTQNSIISETTTKFTTTTVTPGTSTITTITKTGGSSTITQTCGTSTGTGGTTVTYIMSQELTSTISKLVSVTNPAAGTLTGYETSTITCSSTTTLGSLITETLSETICETLIISSTYSTTTCDTSTESSTYSTTTCETTSKTYITSTSTQCLTTTTFIPFHLAIDFGNNTSPVQFGWVGLGETNGYNATLGYGWVDGVDNPINVAYEDRGAGSGGALDDLERDIHYITEELKFKVAVPNGDYYLTLYYGDTYAHGPFDISDNNGIPIGSGLSNAENEWKSYSGFETVATGFFYLKFVNINNNPAFNGLELLCVTVITETSTACSTFSSTESTTETSTNTTCTSTYTETTETECTTTTETTESECTTTTETTEIECTTTTETTVIECTTTTEDTIIETTTTTADTIIETTTTTADTIVETTTTTEDTIVETTTTTAETVIETFTTTNECETSTFTTTNKCETSTFTTTCDTITSISTYSSTTCETNISSSTFYTTTCDTNSNYVTSTFTNVVTCSTMSGYSTVTEVIFCITVSGTSTYTTATTCITTTLEGGLSENGSSFPWWIILIGICLAAGYVVFSGKKRRRS